MNTAAIPRRRILLSAFACSPLWGSEPGVGWRWACELAERHDVTLLTHAYFRGHLEDELAARPRPGLRIVYHHVPGVGGHPHTQLNSRAYYWLWQLSARPHVRRLLARSPVDAVHHLTWGSYRLPCFLGGLGAPLVIGPVGGGEGAPSRWYRSWPLAERAFYRLRAASIALSRWDPFVMWSMAHARCVLTKTPQTRAALPWFAHAKAIDCAEIGVAVVAPERGARTPGPLRLVYAGRLLGGKGAVYAVEAMRLLRDRGVPARLHMAGNGRLLRWLRARIDRLALHTHVSLLGKRPREQMDALYDASDLLVFPSWHDSSGNVVTESLARGLPVLCLDVGGPSMAIDEHCGIVVPTTGLDEAGIAAAIADRLEALAREPQRLAGLSRGARQRAGTMSWRSRVDDAYAYIEQRLGWAGDHPESANAAKGRDTSWINPLAP